MQALHRQAFPVMGTTASVHVDDDVGEREFIGVVDLFRTEMERLEAVFSVFREDSEISRINSGDLHHLDASSEVIEVLDACAYLENISSGAFSIRRSAGDSRIDPSGFVKGWATERSAAVFAAAGLAHWYVGVGGDFMLHGGMRGGDPWTIGIADPRDASMVSATIEVMTGGVATSGTSERGLHMWDARIDEPARSFASVTVVGPSLTWADAFATSVFVMGEPGIGWLSQFEGYEAFVQ